MGEVDLERFRVGYLRTTATLNAGDVASAFAWIPDGFEWHVLPEVLGDDRPETPPVLRGRDQVIGWFKDLIEDWNYRLEPQGFEELDDGSVVVQAIGRITGRVTGLNGEVRFTQFWEFGDDGVPIRARERLDDYRLDPQ